MKAIKKNKILSYAIICFTYIVAIAAAILMVKVMHTSAWVELLVADVIGTIIVFGSSTLFKNTSIYDPYWSFAPVVTTIILLVSYPLNFYRVLVSAAILVWGVRLTVNWAIRFKDLRHEDWRYAAFRSSIEGPMFILLNFLGFHLFPTLVVFCCMLPVTAAFTTDSAFSIVSIIFFLIAGGAIFLETFADYHMNLFKKDLADGYVVGCCKYGLWRNCRHPNYFGEIVFWWAIYFMMLFTLPGQWYLFFGPLINTLMFIFVSIPMAENHISGKPGFRRYKASTHLLIPIPKFYANDRDND